MIASLLFICVVVFFFNDTATTEIYTLSLHDALPISLQSGDSVVTQVPRRQPRAPHQAVSRRRALPRSEEHTSELQSQSNLVCRLLLEKKNTSPRPLPSFSPLALTRMSSTSSPPHDCT